MDKKHSWLNGKRVMQLLALLAVGGCLWFLRRNGYSQPAVLLSLKESYPLLAPMLFVTVYAGSVAALLPTLPLNVAAGVFWGPWLGSLLAVAGSWAGSLLAFWLSRTAFGQPFARRSEVRLIQWVQNALEQHGWRVIAFIRLNPMFPGPINYVLGLTTVTFRTFAWATLVFITPLTIVFALFGHFAGDVILRRSAEYSKLALLIGAIAAVGLALYLLARRTNLGSGREAASQDQDPT